MSSPRGKDKELAVVVLAAGEGTRMKSQLPKVLHPLCGRPLVDYVLEAARKLRPGRVIAVVRPGPDFDAYGGRADLVFQKERRGTAHAVAQAQSALKGFAGDVLVLSGDTPLLTTGTLRKLIRNHRNTGSTATLLTARLDGGRDYGRIVRGADGSVERIVEAKDSTPAERNIQEVNSGTYVFRALDLFRAVGQVGTENRQAEFYLTDCIGILKAQGRKIGGVAVDGDQEIAGINTRVDLANAERTMRTRINEGWMGKGVTLVDPNSTYIDSTVRMSADSVLHPFTFLHGRTRIGAGSTIGPMARVIDSDIGAGVTIENAVVMEARVADGASIGPFSYLRPGSRIKAGAKVGTFVEIKKSEIGQGSKVPHLSYVGDAVIGKNVNVGAGSITCNYDGNAKAKTVIEDDAFIGSDTQLVAPVRVGKGAVTGAGSTI
ncbi:MAG: bifunctional UDP-N-acetylglucosamine diphosphorylase/glucosamine-1-phosphate N-acetyltransferase GlmU, partial [Terriglobia bacterium]